ncbi:hypothetical protein [Burkholderia multivorans]|uniref:hypothetical protein n=1 Tax=Burkholderia multivorans TaxID=87883 RepID=UPI0021BF0CC8|nr:hypothetical protein [Burkholderia multivorans]MDN7948802.1 hypothetical protein [Burkholderia multivorans]
MSAATTLLKSRFSPAPARRTPIVPRNARRQRDRTGRPLFIPASSADSSNAASRRSGAGDRPFNRSRFEEPTMARIGAFCITTWLAAAILYFGQHSVAMIALSGVVAFGGFDLLRP